MTKNRNYSVLIIILITVVAYSPGLSGGFLFDDFINLKNISVFSRFEGIDAFIRYIFSYNSGALKRPISTLSFLINSTTWPANPLFFKLTNLFIHITNSILLFIVTKQILTLFKYPQKTVNSIAILHMAIWTLHPFFVSTTLYVVQRMAMLPVTFILLGMYFYIHGRLIVKDNNFKARIYLFIAIYVCTFFAVLSKENGIILPLLIFLLEYVIINNRARDTLKKIDKYAFLVIPSSVVIISFLISIPHFLDGYGIRSFTMTERLLSESRVLVMYLYHFFTPEYFTEGVFADVIITSKSLFNPITTITSILFLSILLFAAITYRKKYRLLSFSILFFFISSVIESTIVPLELYFEHRAYLSMLFIALPLSVFTIKFIDESKVKLILILVIFSLLPITTYFRSNLWGDNINLIMRSADKFPQSVRAIENKANILNQLNRNQEALILLENAINSIDRLSLQFNYFNLKCGIGESKIADIDHLLNTIKSGVFIKEDRASLITTFKLLNSDLCFKSSKKYTISIIDIVKNKPAYKNIKIKQAIDYYHGIYLLNNNAVADSFTIFVKYIEEFSAFDNTIDVVKRYINMKEFKYAEKLLTLIENKITLIRYPKKNYAEEIIKLKNIVNQ